MRYIDDKISSQRLPTPYHQTPPPNAAAAGKIPPPLRFRGILQMEKLCLHPRVEYLGSRMGYFLVRVLDEALF